MKRTYLISGIIALFISLITIGGYHFLANDSKIVKIEHISTPSSKNVNYTPILQKGNITDFSAIAEKVVDAVVHIKSTRMTEYGNQDGFQYRKLPDPFKDFFKDDPFGDFFERRFEYYGPNQKRGQQPNTPQPISGTGSGVIINEDGYIITNYHVIDQAEDIEITLHDNRTYKAIVIGTDPSTDLALLQIKEKSLPYLPFVNSDDVKIGEWVLAIGNPFSLNSTVTAGIVSAKARNININKEKFAVESFIQTDAAINPGNSGGALVNMDGGLVGINTAIASRTGSYNGYGFAVPSNIVNKVVEDLLKYGSVQRGVLGIMIRNVDGNLASEKGLNIYSGAYVDSLFEKSAGATAGIKKGDVIIKVNDSKINTSSELQEIIARHRPGDKVSVLVDRKGVEKTFNVVLNNPNGSQELSEKKHQQLLRQLGADMETLDKEKAKKLEIESGVKVTNLYTGLLRKQTQMKTGFIITHVDGQKIKDIDSLASVLKNKKGGVMLEGIYEDLPGKYYYAFGIDS